MAKSATKSAASAMTPEEAYDNLRASIADPALDVLWRALRRTGEVIELTTKVMSSLPDDHASEQPLREFERLLEHDYREFARRDNFSGEADALSELQSVFDRMRRIRLAPHLASRNICSVAGGFSSGKSSLLNRLMDTDILPTKITPTTAIPTYVSHGDGEQTIRVFNHRGGSRAIEPPTLREMTHGFGSLREGGDGIPLKKIVSWVSIRTPRLGKQKVAFVDTPGYTNRGDGDVIEDEQTAMREVIESRFLIWVVDCERGELPQEDIRIVREFASRRAASEEPIYFVLNKADKKQRSDRIAILKSVKDTVEKHKIPHFGVSLYSAHDEDGTSYSHTGGAFDAFLEMIDSATAKVALDAELKAVFDRYTQHHDREEKRFRRLHGLLNRLGLEREEEEDDGAESRLDRDLDRHAGEVEGYLDYHRRYRAEALSLQGRFVKCAQEFMSAVGLPTTTRVMKAPGGGESGTAMQEAVRDFGDGRGAVPAHRHLRGGGWVSDTATVMDSAYVGRNARVFGDAEVSDSARITGRAQVSDEAEVSGNARISGDARVQGRATVADCAKVSGDAEVSGKATVEDYARVSDTAKVSGNVKVSGGGHISDKAVVSGNAEVSGNAKVFDNAKVSSRAVVSGDAMVLADAKISGDAVVLDNAKVRGDARVSGNATVLGGAMVSDKAVVSGNAEVSGNAMVAGNAEVSDKAAVSGDAMVLEDAKISGDAVVLDNANVRGDARVSDNAKVFDNAKVSHKAVVSGNAEVFGNAEVLDNARVRDNAKVCDNAAARKDAEVSGDELVYRNKVRTL